YGSAGQSASRQRSRASGTSRPRGTPWQRTVTEKRAIPLPGSPYPLGATLSAEGVNFSVYSANATGLELLLFNDAHDPAPAGVIAFDPERNRTYHYWHAYVPQLRAGQVYAYRADGPWRPGDGLRFDRTKVLLDP